MNKRNTIVPVTLGFNTVTRIPESWTAFTFRGFLYGRDMTGRWICLRKLETVSHYPVEGLHELTVDT